MEILGKDFGEFGIQISSVCFGALARGSCKWLLHSELSRWDTSHR